MERPSRQAYHTGRTENSGAPAAGNKAPGSDGIGVAFFKVNWETVKDDMVALFNQTYIERIIRDKQKHGLVVCIPKKPAPTKPADCRPITLLNTDYKKFGLHRREQTTTSPG